MIKPLFGYGNVLWTACDKENPYRMLNVQKRAARIVKADTWHGPLLFHCLTDLRWLNGLAGTKRLFKNGEKYELRLISLMRRKYILKVTFKTTPF